MKRLVSCIIVIAIALCLFPLECLAAESSSEEKIVTFFDDGSYLVESISGSNSRASGTKDGSKTYEYHSSDGTCLWEAVLSGSFTYTGSSSSCTSASVSVTIYNSAWYIISKSSSRSGDTAYGSVTMGRKSLGVTVQKIPLDITLTCDEDGNLS